MSHSLDKNDILLEKYDITDVQNMIHMMYKLILSRSADTHGLKTYTDLICNEGALKGSIKVLNSLINSEEYKNLLIDMHKRESKNTFHIEPKKNEEPVQHIISLGTHCLSSYFLKLFGLKSYSLPFDWLFSSPKMIIDCISNNFDIFLKQENFSSITHIRESKEPGADHLYYKNKYNINDIFTHRDPTNEEDYQYFVRTVHRFRDLMKSSDSKLFVMISRDGHNIEESFENIINTLSNVTTNFSLLCIQLNHPTYIEGCSSVSLVKRIEQHRLYSFTPSSLELGLGFDDEMDNMTIFRLLNTYPINCT